jgi:nucleoside-diphosphate-sugar epimerase
MRFPSTPPDRGTIETEAELDDVLTSPRAELIDSIKSVRSPLIIVGAGGKMGPTLAALAKRAADLANQSLEVVAISRFSDTWKRDWLDRQGVRTIACDLLDREALHDLPETKNLVYLVGQKFGTAQNPERCWAINTLVPALVAERYCRARIVALSTGNVYALSSAAEGGSTERDPLTPVGEYANAAVGRERIFGHMSQQHGTEVILLRLFYAIDLRYGVLRDLADRVWTGQPVDLSNGWFNCIWQGDANEMILRSLDLATCPPMALNLTSRELFRVRTAAERLGELLGKAVQFTGVESDDALIGNTSKFRKLFGDLPTPLETMLRWTAAWVKSGGRSLGKPTYFEVRNGRF